MQPAKSRLGKGLDSLLADVQGDPSVLPGNQVIALDLGKILANPEQPRKEFDDEALHELADSIKEKGVIQPIIVQDNGDGTYQIVAGERRYRASKLLGNTTVPAIIRNYTIEEKMEIALIENIQREGLNPVEEAMAFRDLMERFNLNQEEVAKKIGKNRSTVANSVRLLKLPQKILESISAGRLSAGHARTILSVQADQQEALYQAIQDGNLSVRDTEALARTMNGETLEEGKHQKVIDSTKGATVKVGTSSGNGSAGDKKNVELIEIEEKLIMTLGTKVQIKGDSNSGRIEIVYYSMEDLERLHDLLSK